MSLSTAPRKINLKHIAHVYYTHKNLHEAHQFLLDFGLSVIKREGDTIYYRGYGTEPFVYFHPASERQTQKPDSKAKIKKPKVNWKTTSKEETIAII